MPSILITGANRGLGLEFARQYGAEGWRVYASCRDPGAADALNGLAGEHDGLTAHRLDVTDDGQIAALAGALGDEPIDVLLNNAGISGGARSGFGEIDYARWPETLRVNTLGPARMAEAFVAPLTRGGRKLMVCISSRMGSIAQNSGGYYAYRSSKAALNAVVASLAVDLAPRGITVVAFHPGWVATDMGGAGAPLSPAESVRGMRAVIERLAPADTGRFLNYDGAEIPW